MYLYCPKQQAPDEAQYYGSQADVAQVDEEGALLRNVNSGAQSTPASVATSGKGKGSKGSKGMRSKGMGMRSKGMGMGSKGMGSKAKGAIRL
jgi:hypothetical protein